MRPLGLPCWDCSLNEHGFCAQRHGRKFCCCSRPLDPRAEQTAGEVNDEHS